jgi:hypothetical protein
MSMTASQLDTWLKDNARDQLRTFNKTITITATVWTQGTGADSGTSTSATSPNWNLTSAASSVFTGDLDSGIGSGLIADADDVAASIVNTVRSAVDEIEGAIGNVSWNAQVCHSSCHTNCHTSRGRR